MCGIVGILSRPPTRPTPTRAELLGGLDAALAARGDVLAVAAAARTVDAALHGLPGVLALGEHHELVAAITSRLDQLDAYAAEVEAALASGVTDGDELEQASAASIALRDVLWAIRRDRLRTVQAVTDLAGRGAGPAALAGYLAIQQAFSAIDRMEVRGRDSAGIHVLVWDHDLDVDDPALAATVAERSRDPLFQSGAARFAGRALSIVYKAAAEIGELGDNTKAMRAEVAADRLLRLAPHRRAGPGRRARPHPLGERRHHLRAQRPSREQRRARTAGRGDAAVDRRRAQRRRRQPRRPPRRARPAVRRADHDRRQGHPRPRRPPPPVRQRRPVRGVPPHGGLVRGLGRHRRRRRRRAGPAVPGAQRQRAGRLHRSRRGSLHRRQRAVRRRRGDRPLRPPRRRARRAGRRPRRGGRRHRGRHPPPRLRRLGATCHRRRRRDGRGHDTRHRPRRQPALPAQGDHRVARQPGQDAARQDRRAATAGCGPSSGRGRCRRTSPSGWPPARSAGSA